MRTTLTIDDDVFGVLQRRAESLGVPFKDLVNQLLRQSLAESLQATTPSPPRTRPHSFGFKPGIDLDRVNQMADQLEAEAFRDRQQSGSA